MAAPRARASGLPMNLERLQKSPLWRLKVRLQFTGWLQYAPPLVLGVGLLALAGLAAGIGLPAPLLRGPLGLGAALLFVAIFDVATVRLGLRPFEPSPHRRDAADTLDLLLKRRSCRSFQRRPLTDADRAELLELVRRRTDPAFLLGDAPIRLEYVAAPLTVWPVVGAREFLVAIAPKAYDRRAVIDVGRSLEGVVVHATRMGVATCWIGPGADPGSIARHLGDRYDPARDHVVCVCAIGYASRYMPLVLRFMPALQHRRLPLAELFRAAPDLRAPLKTDAAPFDRFAGCYEACRWSPSSYNSQTTRCCAARAEDGALRFDFLATTDSRFYAPVALGIWCANWEIACEAKGLPGRFRALDPTERGAPAGPALPRYDLSWIVSPEALGPG